MRDRADHPRSVTLSLPPEEHWTLHHVLLDRIEHERTSEESTHSEPPALEVYQAFERLDTGRTSFTLGQLEAVRAVLADYHHRTSWWEIERAQVESLLHRITERIDQRRPTTSAG